MRIARRPLSLLAAGLLAPSLWAAPAGDSSSTWCGTGRHDAGAAIWAHREHLARRGPVIQTAQQASEDVGEVAVILDHGDLAIFANPLDLRSAGLIFTPEGAGFRVSRADSAVTPDAGDPLPLSDDDTELVPLPFAFPFYGASYDQVFVNSDGNLTFDSGDSASTARDLSRLMGGPPRIAPLLSDYNPEDGGSVRALSEPGRFTVTWTGVPRWEEDDSNTFRVALLADGSIEFAYGDDLSRETVGVVGVAPGAGSGDLTPTDLSEAAGVFGTAIAESFRFFDELDLVATTQRFYATHGDDYDQLVVFTTQRLIETGVFAFASTVQNRTTGIGTASYDSSAAYGSAGGLESVVMMDNISKYPIDPRAVVNPPDSSLGVLAHETGHRWLARVSFDDSAPSDALLGRQQAHWSFFMSSAASHLEGNEIADRGDGSFETVAASVRYGPLDQYLMGVRSPAEVPPFFYVSDVSGTVPSTPERNPEAGVVFTGVRNDVTVDQVISAEGARNPAPSVPASPWRQAFILVAVGGAPLDAQVEHVDRIRRAWPAFFANSIEGRWTVETELQ